MQAPKNFNPHPFAYHQELELMIDSLTNLGLGVGRVDNWVIMVPFVIPGERVKVRIFRNRDQYSEADLVEVLEASDKRVEPQCALFGRCGGCQYQHIEYSEQLKYKAQQIEELMLRNGGIEAPVAASESTDQIYAYRSKITPHYNKPNREGEQPIGFLIHGMRHAIVDVLQCPIATDRINQALPEVRRRALAEGGKKRRLRGGTLLLRDTLEGVVTDPKATVSEKVGSKIFHFKAGEFFQNNPFILPKMVDYVKGEALRGGMNALIDAYCGVGLFALSCADHFESVLGVEISEAAIQLAKANAQVMNVNNVRFQIGKAEAIFQNVHFSKDETSVIIDPPRKGCDRLFIDQLIDFNPQRIIYVSCDPATQARDLRYFIEGGYQIIKVQPFDLFPHTRHIENIVTLDR